MIRESRIMNLADLISSRAPFGDTHRVLVASLHPHVERLEASLEKPAGEGIRGLSPDDHLPPHLFDVGRRASDYATQDVVMPVQIFRRRVNHHVRAIRQRPRVDRARESRIHHKGYAALLGENRDLRDVDHTACRIHRRFDEYHARILPDRVAPHAPLIGIREAHLDSHGDELFGEEFARSAVDPGAREQVIARSQQREQRACRRAHSAREDKCRFSAFEHGNALLNYLLIRRVPVTRVHDAGPAFGAELLHVVDGLKQRCRNRRPGVAMLGPAVNGNSRFARWSRLAG